MIRTLTLAGAAVAGAALAFAAQAHPGHDGAPGAPAGAMMMMHHGMADMDKNGDGVVTRDEFLSHPSALFDKLDANHDGKLTKDELAAAHEHMIQVCKEQKQGDAAPHDVPCGPMGPGGPGGMHMMMMHHMEGLDANHDGRISFEELQEPLRKHFLAMDKNNNGYIDKDELPGAGGDVVIEQRVEKK
jgi:Ca2+-binding EF-hand superfamily protein